MTGREPVFAGIFGGNAETVSLYPLNRGNRNMPLCSLNAGELA